MKHLEISFELRKDFQKLLETIKSISILRIDALPKMGTTSFLHKISQHFKKDSIDCTWLINSEELTLEMYQKFLKSKSKILMIDLDQKGDFDFIVKDQLKCLNKLVIFSKKSLDLLPDHVYTIDEILYEEFIAYLSTFCDQYVNISWSQIKDLYKLCGSHPQILQKMISHLSYQTVEVVLQNQEILEDKRVIVQESLLGLSPLELEILQYLSLWYKDSLQRIFEFFVDFENFEKNWSSLIQKSLVIQGQDDLFYVPQIIQEWIRAKISAQELAQIKSEFLKNSSLYTRSFVLFHSYPCKVESYLELVDYKGPKRNLFLLLMQDFVLDRMSQKLCADSEILAYATYQLESGVLLEAKESISKIQGESFKLRAKFLLFRINFLLLEDVDSQPTLLMDIYDHREQLASFEQVLLLNSVSSHFHLVGKYLKFESKIEVLEEARSLCIKQNLADSLHIILVNLNLNYRYLGQEVQEQEIQNEILGKVVSFDSPNETKLGYRKIEILLELEHFHEANELLRVLLAQSQESQDLNLLAHYYFYSGILALFQEEETSCEMFFLAQRTFTQIGDVFRKLLSLSLKTLSMLCHRKIKDAFQENQILKQETLRTEFDYLLRNSKLYQMILLFMQDMKTNPSNMKELHEFYPSFVAMMQKVDLDSLNQEEELEDFLLDPRQNLLLQKVDAFLFYSLKREFRLVCFNDGKITRISHYRVEKYLEQKTRYDVLIDLVQSRFYERQSGDLNLGRKKSLLNLFVILCLARKKLDNQSIFQILWQKKYHHETDEPVIRMNINRLKKALEPIPDIYIQRDLITGEYFVNPSFKYLIILHQSDYSSIQEVLQTI
ncbi:hypothetical protein MJH12_01305 [bacterium]|nr:hypothetical protein [bacterium]